MELEISALKTLYDQMAIEKQQKFIDKVPVEILITSLKSRLERKKLNVLIKIDMTFEEICTIKKDYTHFQAITKSNKDFAIFPCVWNFYLFKSHEEYEKNKKESIVFIHGHINDIFTQNGQIDWEAIIRDFSLPNIFVLDGEKFVNLKSNKEEKKSRKENNNK